MMKKVAFYTLGCKVNQVETAALAELFRNKGFEIVDFDYPADLYIINTCCVTSTSEQKSRQIIRKALKLNHRAGIVVTGCYAQTNPAEIMRIPGVSLVIGTKERDKIVEQVRQLINTNDLPRNAVTPYSGREKFEELTAVEFSGRTRATIKIQDGCQNFCSYCIVPYARGPVRSMPPQKILEKVSEILCRGYKEIILSGIHLGVYGVDLPGQPSLAFIVEKVASMPGLQRLRLGSLEPQDVSDELVDLFAKNQVLCPHIHLSLQSGSDIILQRMNRRYTTSDFYGLVEKIRRRSNRTIAVSTDLIVGFPGETEELFEETVKFIQKIGFSRIHIFPYSLRPGTLAARMTNQISSAVKKQRVQVIKRIANKMSADFHAKFIGKNVEVLVEEKKGNWLGYSKEYIQVLFVNGEEDLKNQLVKVKVISADSEGVRGERV